MTKKKKIALTYAIVPSMQSAIREYVNHVHAITGCSKSHIVSTILFAKATEKNICPESLAGLATEEQQ